MCNSYIIYNLNMYMCVIVIVFNCTVHMHELFASSIKYGRRLTFDWSYYILSPKLLRDYNFTLQYSNNFFF